MARKPKGFADPARFDHDGDGKPGGSLAKGPVEVTVTVSGQVSDGRGGEYPAGTKITVTPEQAAGLRRQGFAK